MIGVKIDHGRSRAELLYRVLAYGRQANKVLKSSAEEYRFMDSIFFQRNFYVGQSFFSFTISN